MKALTTPLAIVIAAALLALSGYLSVRELASVEQRRFEMWPIGETAGAYRIDTYTGAMRLCTPQGCGAPLRGSQSVEDAEAEIRRMYQRRPASQSR